MIRFLSGLSVFILLLPPAFTPGVFAQEDEIRTHLLKGECPEAAKKYNLWMFKRSDSYRRLKPDPQLRSLLKQNSYSDSQIESPLLEPRDLAHLQYLVFMRRIVTAATEGEKSKDRILHKLFALVTTEMAPLSTTNSYEWPDDMLIRGYGSCDQMSWVLCALAEQASIPSAVVFLRDPVSGVSPHTIAAFFINSRWQILDPFAALNFGGTKGVGLMQLIAAPTRFTSILPKTGTCLLTAENLSGASILVYGEPRGMLPRWSLFEQNIKPEKIGLHTWFNPFARITFARKCLALALGVELSDLNKRLTAMPHKPEILPYGEPMRVYRALTSPPPTDTKNVSRSQGIFRGARILHLTGKHSESIAAINRAMKDSKTDGNKEIIADSHRYRALSLAGAKKWLEAAEGFRAADTGFWKSTSRWNRVKCLRKLGKKAEAAAEAELVPEPRKAGINQKP